MKRSTPVRLGIGLAATAALLVTAVSALAADEIGESSPILSNPNQQAITRGEQLAAKTYGWKVKTLDADLSPDRQVSDVDTLVNLGVKGLITWTLDAGAAGAAYKRALDKGIAVIDYGSTSNVTSSVFDERGLRLHGGRQGRRVHRQARAQGQGARDRRASGAVHHQLHQLLHEGREGRGPAGRGQAEQRQGHRRDRPADRPGPPDQASQT